MKIFKSIFALLLLLSVSVPGYAASDGNGLVLDTETIELQVQNTATAPAPFEDDRRDCTVNIDITLDDGSTVTGTIIIHDISWFTCTKIKIGNWINGL